MFAALERDGGVFRPSAFWRELNARNVAQLERDGLDNFKRTLAQNYFTWVGLWWRHDQFRSMVRKMRLTDWPALLRDFPRHDRSTGLSRSKFAHLALFTRMLWLYALRFDRLGLLERIEEPAFGNPFPIHLRGRLISQDLANSALELYAMLDGLEIDFDAPLRVCEIGAGYGRNAFLVLSLFPNCSYTIVDIPPALYVAREYLGAVCPGARATFLLPHEAARLPAASFDLVLNISSFHEMTPAQVEAYFAMVDRLADSAAGARFYVKQWKRWHNPADDVTMTEAGYPWRPEWTRLYSRTTLAQPSFFEAVYRL